METKMDEDLVRKLAKNIAKDIKTEADLGEFSKLLKKIVVKTALDAELTEHLGYEKNDSKGDGSGNSRNGNTKGTGSVKKKQKSCKALAYSRYNTNR